MRFQGILMYIILALGCFASLGPMAAQAATRSVNCDTGDMIEGALPDLKPGDTLVVSGTCIVNGNLIIPPEMANVTFEGNGTASIRADNFSVLGREITIRGFDIMGGSNGIGVARGGTAFIDGNTIHDSGSGVPGRGIGINVAQHAFATIVGNTIRNNAGHGINVLEGSVARIGYGIDNLANSLPNVIEGNGLYGIQVAQNGVAGVVGGTIAGNRMGGILVRLGSRATIANNSISGNRGDGITVVDSSSVYFESTAVGSGIPQTNRTDADSPNQGFGISCTIGGSVSKALGTLMGVKGAVEFDRSCVDNITR